MALRPEDKPKKRELKFKYIFADEYNAKYATGVYGGVTPGGEIVANFFLERHGLPISQTYALKPEGSLGEVLKNEPEDLQETMVRIVESGVIINVTFAKTLNDWLTRQIEVAEKIIGTKSTIKE